MRQMSAANYAEIYHAAVDFYARKKKRPHDYPGILP